MTAILAGVRVLEVAEYAMAPSAAAVLADWGADVIKVERIDRGDTIRGAAAWGIGPDVGGFTFLWEPFNRGKRSIGLDVRKPEGRELVLDLARQADIFITNFLPATRKSLRLDVEDIRDVNPKIIFGRGSAHGPKGPEAERGGFDASSYWLRSGLGAAAAPEGVDEPITLAGPAIGDIQTGMALAGGLAAALYHREKTGEGLTVDVSLMGCGIWAMQSSLVGVNIAGLKELPHANRRTAPNPIHNIYKTKDGRWLSLAMLQADQYWCELCEAMERPDLITDPRFATFEGRAARNQECIVELDGVFIQRTLAEWIEALATQSGPWSKVQLVSDLNDDEQAWANGYLQKVDYGDGRTLTLAPAPVQFNEASPTLRPAPALAAHTEEVLLELGLDWDRIIELKDIGAVR